MSSPLAAARRTAGAVLVAAVAILATASSQEPGTAAGRADGPAWLAPYRDAADRLLAAARSDAAWERLAELTDTFGPRLSGSRNLEDAIAWAADAMRADGLERVHLDPVAVPHWVRGRERATLVRPSRQNLPMLGLGGSVATPPGGLQAEAIVVRSFEELEAAGDRARGRIVVFNAPFTTYNRTVQYRQSGPARAARQGAVAALIRSVGPPGHRTPHTGSTTYAADGPRIPAAAISTEDADRLQRLQDRGVPIVIQLQMDAHRLPDATSHNLVAELRGRERPTETVVLAAHIDSWDVGTGAIDDGGGCVAVWEAVRLLKATGLRPRRTVRVVLFTNEENGLRGAASYRDTYRRELDDHVLMLEADIGLFAPIGFGFSGSPGGRARVRDIARLLEPIGADRIEPAGGGADIAPSVQTAGVPAMSLEGDQSRYFVVHHTDADTVDKITPAEVSRAVAAIAVMAYVVAEMPARLDEE